MESGPNKPDLSMLRIDRDESYDDRPRSGRWKYLAGAVVVILVLVGYFMLRDRVKPTAKVKIGTAAMITGSDAASTLVATGYVVAQRKAEVASKGTGRLVSLPFEEGDTVSAGQTIAVLDNDDIRANLEAAKANLAQAEVDTLNAGRNFRRQQSLLKTGAVTEAILEDAEARYRASLAAVQASAATVRTAAVNLENTYIRAPFSGTILTKNAEVGEIVAPFASSASSKGSVVTLADMGSLEVEADVAEANINKVQIGQPVDITLDAYPTIRYPGYVKKIVPTADRSRATVLTKVAFREPDARVLPEMSARVNFYLDTAAAATSTARLLAVPKDALTTRDGQSVVYRIEGDQAMITPVTTGKQLGNMVEITQGLQAGDRVVLSPPGNMNSGQKVDVAS